MVLSSEPEKSGVGATSCEVSQGVTECHTARPEGEVMISKPVNTAINFDWPDRFASDNDAEISFNNRGPGPNAVVKQRRRVSHFSRLIA